LELLHQAVPFANTIGALVNTEFPGVQQQLTELQDGASALGTTLSLLKATRESDLEDVFQVVVGQNIEALLVTADPLRWRNVIQSHLCFRFPNLPKRGAL
jgi:ABC-type uncharacterized transport system substrate-binding protein